MFCWVKSFNPQAKLELGAGSWELGSGFQDWKFETPSTCQLGSLTPLFFSSGDPRQRSLADAVMAAADFQAISFLLSFGP
jgi:hypothetical protein